MRLQQLKIAGFKSFVDPTTIKFPGELVGIVGPNGCGKSNTIDAVRWVMGESSAKNLRGENASDVIFNGSSARKPLGQASVELVFDNEHSPLTGPLAEFKEISIKRLVTRDGQSNYYLNGARCRRKDITEVFLGTGLGPRSYSIIAQNTISNLVEAKPEDMRVFLEEAAGISKYKERRRETENRMRHTRENLTRVQDIRDELGKQLDRLQRQSEAAIKFKELKAQERLQRAQLLVLRWQSLSEKLDKQQSTISEQNNKVEAIIATQRHYDAEIEQTREAQHDTREFYQTVQSQYYQLGAEIARLEEALSHQLERREQLQQDYEQAQTELKSSTALQQTDQEKITGLKLRLDELEPLLEHLREVEQETEAQLEQAELAYETWQAQWDEFNQTSAQSSQTAHVAQAKVQHCEERLARIQQQLQKLQAEQQLLDPQAASLAVAELAAREEELQDQLGNEQENLASFANRLTEQRQQLTRLDSDLAAARRDVQNLGGRQASLQALQAAALADEEGAVKQWMQTHQLTDAPRLAQQLQVQAGWETAVEAILGGYLQAVCVDRLDDLAGELKSVSKGQVRLLDNHAQSEAPVKRLAASLLFEKIDAPIKALSSLFAGIYAVESVSEAVQLRQQLQGHEAVVTREGLVFGAASAECSRLSDGTAGVLAREKELKAVDAEIELKQQVVAEIENQLDAAREQLTALEQAREQQQQRVTDYSRQIADLAAQLRVAQAKLDQINQRLTVVTQDLNSEEAAFAACQTEIETARTAWQEAMAAMDEHADRREVLQHSRTELNQRLDEARAQNKASHEQTHQNNLEWQTLNAQYQALVQNITRMTERIQQLQTRVNGLQLAIEQSQNPDDNFEQQLQQKLHAHTAKDEEMKQARQAYEAVEEKLRHLEQHRQAAEEEARTLQSHIAELRMNAQEAVVRKQTLEEQLAETEYQLTEVAEQMPADANINDMEQQLEGLERRIQRLGAINLAAIEEYETESERKVYLDSQYDDLTQALQTLENAIEKIDKETRVRFQETFEKVNHSFSELFPKLFGGGTAYLELTGTDLLDSGVTVMARPPGKRNSSIHLLSGGEKALTAIALVFAIFQLNPAPFCMLDEVDAPLDDANVIRFCNLVREMSKSVQFIFITHNKITMELASHLSGVTMHEPGVSRLVSVNIDEAVSLAEA
jgi:chromosome segregation protein